MKRPAMPHALTLAAAAAVAMLAAAGSVGAAASTAPVAARVAPSTAQARGHHPVSLEVFAPGNGDNAGIGGAGWFVDLEADFPGGANGLARAGFSGFQLTGPGVHANAAPFPGSFSTGRDDRIPGLVVLGSTTNSDRPGFHGPGTNLANLFNLTGVTNRNAHGPSSGTPGSWVRPSSARTSTPRSPWPSSTTSTTTASTTMRRTS